MKAGTTTGRTISLPRALPHQLPAILDGARFKVVVCGRRWGKTALGLLATVRGHGPRRGALRGAIDGAKIWWVAPDYPTAAEIWRDLKRATRLAWGDKDEAHRRIDLTSGGSVTVKSAHDPGSLVSVGLDGVVIDEAAKVPPEAWQESLRPTLSDRRGWAVFIGTPKGHNWFHDLYEHAGVTPGWARWQRPTWDNPLVPPAEIEAARDDMPRYFEQEYGASFLDVEGAEWPHAYFDGIGYDELPPSLPVRFRLLALDPSKGKSDRTGDYSSLADVVIDTAAVAWVDPWLRVLPTEAVEDEVVGRLERGRYDAVVVECNGFQELIADNIVRKCAGRGIPCPMHKKTSVENKEVRIRLGLGPVLAQRRVRMRTGSSSYRLALQQLREFPSAAHDDFPDSVALAFDLVNFLVRGKR